MKKLITIALSIGLVSLNAQNSNLRKVENTAFKAGEELVFKASYGFVTAAEATLKVQETDSKISGRSAYHFVGTGNTLGAFSWFFDVDDRYESYVDQQAMVPWLFIRRVNEGGFKLSRDIYFNQNDTTAKVNGKEYETVPNVQDLLSAFYYCRTLNLQAAKVGEIFTIETFFDMENYPMRIKFLGRDTIKTDLGKVACLKFRPLLQEGRVFKEEEDMTIWISDDQCKVPIRMKTDLLIGSLKMDLHTYKNLRSSLNIVR